ncbi:hypothetical protein P4S91_27290, partial [Aneurinibacillus aneurinilyticus]|uniref:hypothetical protein n=1 Tax=Aneurinibacillus aneurinilyticus TaxID=1391 RepID=UPI002E1F0CF8|nr:hypothetical protein [Aneurinibacillus aneurinilyticus]
IIQYNPKQIATTPCPKRASVRLPHRNTQMFCRSGLGATKRPCLFLVRKRRGNTPTRAPSFFHLMDNQQA